jgi:hypothetical protein
LRCAEVPAAPTTIVLRPPCSQFQTVPVASHVALGRATARDVCDTSPVIFNNAQAAYPLGINSVTWTAIDATNNATSCTQRVEVIDPNACRPDSVHVYVNFKEITYFDGGAAVASSSPIVRERNRITADATPAAWPFGPASGSATTPSRGTLFRIYGFAPEARGADVPEVGGAGRVFKVLADPDVPGASYVDLGGPARVRIDLGTLQPDIMRADGKVQSWMRAGTRLLTDAERNVPGIMLNHNTAWIAVPFARREQLAAQGRPLVNQAGEPTTTALVQFVGFQQWGAGAKRFVEFVDVDVELPCAALDRDLYGFNTVRPISFEGFKKCDYVDGAANGDTIRFNDVWGGNVRGRADSAQPCVESPRNQLPRTVWQVPIDVVQFLSAVNTEEDTARVYFGPLMPSPR